MFLLYFDVTGSKPKLIKGSPKADIERAVFNTLGYDEKIALGKRPEHLTNLEEHTWREINHHLKTEADSLQELIYQLSLKRFGHNVMVGDCFSGGGSIPFEAVRMGCNVFAGDLNPIAGLLTWSDINVCGMDHSSFSQINEFQKRVFDAVNQELDVLGVEYNSRGDRASGFLRCLEAVCPECGVKVPLLDTFVVGKRAGKVVARLKKNGDKFDIFVDSDVDNETFDNASNSSTVDSGTLVCPNCHLRTPLSSIRKDRIDSSGNSVYGMRKWEKQEFLPRSSDPFQERLYAIRFIRPDGSRYYAAPTIEDLEKEEIIVKYVADHIAEWQQEGYIPSSEIEDGEKTSELIRNRGWKYWHQLYSPRQLLYLSLLTKNVLQEENKNYQAVGMLGINKCADFASKLCGWTASVDISTNTFYNQALNPLISWGERGFNMYSALWCFSLNRFEASVHSENTVTLSDARLVDQICDFWITDPPYADAICYHELSEYFLAWDKPILIKAFPEWYTDSKRVLAVRGDEHFSQTMIEIYSNLTRHMNDDGLQVVMFTHSNPAVWAQLALIMWKAGLTVTAAWNIATETDASGLKEGNYVKGTVLLVLRKQSGDEEAYLDELAADIKNEVRMQIQSMQKLDDKEDPNFSDPDYVLAAYAASLKVLTGYKSIGEIDLDYELDLAIHDPSKSEVVKLIERAKKIAYDFIIPLDFDSYLWKELSASERFYIKGLESEKHGNYQVSTYQEYARGFGLSNYSSMMANERANSARLKTPSEFGMRNVDVPGFEDSILRIVLSAIHVSITENENPECGLFFLKTNLSDYWNCRDMIKQLLFFLKETESIDTMSHWKECGEMAAHLYTLVDNDHI